MKRFALAFAGLVLSSAASAGYITLTHEVVSNGAAFAITWNVDDGDPTTDEFAVVDQGYFLYSGEGDWGQGYIPGPGNAGKLHFVITYGTGDNNGKEPAYDGWTLAAGNYVAAATILVFQWDAALNCQYWSCDEMDRSEMTHYRLEQSTNFTMTRPAEVPEPSIIALLGLGVAGLIAARRKN